MRSCTLRSMEGYCSGLQRAPKSAKTIRDHLTPLCMQDMCFTVMIFGIRVLIYPFGKCESRTSSIEDLRHEVLLSRFTSWRITCVVIMRKGNRVTAHVLQIGLSQVKRTSLQHFNRGRRSFFLYRWLAYFVIMKSDNVSMNPAFTNYELETRKLPASLFFLQPRSNVTELESREAEVCLRVSNVEIASYNSTRPRHARRQELVQTADIVLALNL